MDIYQNTLSLVFFKNGSMKSRPNVVVYEKCFNDSLLGRFFHFIAISDILQCKYKSESKLDLEWYLF